MSSVKLTYFAAWGRAGAIRVALRIAGIPFEDEKINFATLKAAPPQPEGPYPLGQLPVLTLDGKTYTQSSAILRWAGRKAGLYPTDELEALRVDEVVSICDDVASSAPQDQDKAAKQAKREAWVAEKLPKFFNLLEARLKSSGGPFVLGEKLTTADLAIFTIIHAIKSGDYDYVPKTAADAWLALGTTHYDAVKANAVVAAAIAPATQ